jgi:hypothetical protein
VKWNEVKDWNGMEGSDARTTILSQGSMTVKPKVHSNQSWMRQKERARRPADFGGLRTSSPRCFAGGRGEEGASQWSMGGEERTKRREERGRQLFRALLTGTLGVRAGLTT